MALRHVAESDPLYVGVQLTLALSRPAWDRLKRIEQETGRKLEELVEAATEEAALDYAKHHGWL